MHSWLTSKRIYCINLFLSKRLVCDIPFSSCSFSILPDFASELFMLHLALLVAVALCLSLTSDTCSDLVNSCRLRELWDSFGGCEAPFLPGISSLSLSLHPTHFLSFLFPLQVTIVFLFWWFCSFSAHLWVSPCLLFPLSTSFSPCLCSPFSLPLHRSLLYHHAPFLYAPLCPTFSSILHQCQFLFSVIALAISLRQHCGFTEQLLPLLENGTFV